MGQNKKCTPLTKLLALMEQLLRICHYKNHYRAITYSGENSYDQLTSNVAWKDIILVELKKNLNIAVCFVVNIQSVKEV